MERYGNNYEIILKQSAQKDLMQIEQFCKNISLSYKNKIKIQIYTMISTLEMFPRAYPKVKNINTYYESRYIPSKVYNIYYEIYENFIIITKIVNSKLDIHKF